MTTDIAAVGDINSGGYIKKANSLIQFNRYIGETKGQSMTLLELKVFTYALSHLDQDSPVLKPVTFSIRDFWKECGITPTSKKYFTLIEDALDKLRSRRGWVVLTDPTGKKKKALVGLIEMPEYSEDEKTCTVNFNPNLAPALLMLKDHFTRYPRISVMRLESQYGFALYDLLCSYEYLNGPLRFSFEDLAERLDATSYNRPSNFKTRIIDMAVNDINKHSQVLNVSCGIEKTGKKMTHAVFTINRLLGPCASVVEPATEEQSTLDITEKIKKQISYDAIAADIQAGTQPFDMQTLTLIPEVIADIYQTTRREYLINDAPMPIDTVRTRFEELNQHHICYVLQCLSKTEKTIKNPRAYVRTSLFNAPTTMDVHYTSRVNEDLAADSVPAGGEWQMGLDEYEAIQRILQEDDSILAGAQ